MAIPQLKGRKNPHRPSCPEHHHWSSNNGRVSVDVGGDWAVHLDEPLVAKGTTIYAVSIRRCPFCNCELEPIPEAKGYRR